MNNFKFKITFVCNNDGKNKTRLIEYKARDFSCALSGVTEYTKNNKTFKKVVSIVDMRGF